MSRPNVFKQEGMWVVVWPAYGFGLEQALGYGSWGEAIHAASNRTISSGVSMTQAPQFDYDTLTIAR